MSLISDLKQRIGAKLSRRQRDALRRWQRRLLAPLSPLVAHDLASLAMLNGSDKWGAHKYAPVYDKYFAPFRRQQVNILEIGVGGYHCPDVGGASLRMWKAYFPKGRVFGIDLHDKRKLEEDRIRIFQGSQADPEFLRRVTAEIGRLDIIIDDGSHINEHVRISFETLFPLLSPQGIYVVEDTHTSYHETYGGNSNDLQDPKTMMNLFKSLADGIQYEEHAAPDRTPSCFDRQITSVHFYHNLVFIFKGDNCDGSSNDEMRKSTVG